MRFMIEQDVLVVWLDEKDWLELSAETGLDLAPDEQFVTTYVPHRKSIQEALVRLAEQHCPAEDQYAVRQASELLSTTGQPIASLMVLSERTAAEQAMSFNVTIPND
jgi:hypothetical protein